MNRILCAFAFLCSFALNVGAADEPRPNILLIVTDDQRPDTIAALGNPHIQTPNLDALVRRGTVFTRATCAHPLCYPSRAELLTGCTGFRNGTYSTQKLNDGVPLLPKVLHEAGYRTWYTGKWHTAGRPSTVGYEDCEGLYASGQKGDRPYVDFRGRPATGYGGWQFQTDDRQRFPEKGIGLTPNISAEFADAAIRVIRCPHDQPFFLHVNFTAPHDPRIWPSDARRVGAAVNQPDHGPLSFERLYDASKLPVPANFLPEHPFDHGNAHGRDELLLPFPRAANDVRQELACYYAVISHMDEQIGRIFQALDETGQRDKTLIVFTSDHGLAIGSHGLVGKQNMYEHTINVPLVIAGPGVPAGARRVDQCYLRDLFPTFCELAGIEAPKVDGESLVPVLRGEKQELYPFIVGYFQDAQRMIRAGNWKLIWYPKIDRWQLFDLANDPDEMSDLIEKSDQKERIAELRGKLAAWLKEQGDPMMEGR